MLRIKEICKQKGISITSLAESIGKEQPSLSRIIKTGITTTDTLAKIAKALDIPIYELFEQNNSGRAICPHCGYPITIELKKES
ncbi:hypothetical protein FACS189434_07880 [Bacteroidia bacterium]|nr:hypothetical protein FACS189434_07880 [Bacteroidia bacterium]